MKNLKHLLAIAGCVTVLGLSGGKVAAQGRGNFDPAQMQQQALETLRGELDVKDDAEWKVLEGALTKVMEAQREVGVGNAGGMGRLFFRGRNGGNNGGGGNGGGNQPRRNNPFGGTPDPDQEALQTAIDNKAPTEEIKAKLAKARASVKAKEAKLDNAREDLKKLLSSRQEAVLYTFGILK